MKRKILAIALSLALLTSLFVFASPISAKSETNDTFFPVSFEASYSSSISSIRTLFGPPTLLEDASHSELKDGRIQILNWNGIFNVTGDFGPSIGVLSGQITITMKQISNYQTGKAVYNGTFDMDFGANGTLLCKVENKREFKYWYYTTRWREYWDADAMLAVIDGTGDFEGFHCDGDYWLVGSTVTFEGIGHFTPN
jgi:hypothetical protein